MWSWEEVSDGRGVRSLEEEKEVELCGDGWRWRVEEEEKFEGEGGEIGRSQEEEEEESDPAALVDPIAKPPLAEGGASHVENKQGQDE